MVDATCSHCALPARKARRILDRPSPYAAYFLPTNQNFVVPQIELKSFILEVQNELTDYNAYVTRVTRILAKERQARASFLEKHKRLLSHIHACPPEIMLKIFLQCLNGNSEARPNYSLCGPEIPVPWVLSAVCRRWRNILRESPSYWTSFKVGSQLHFLEDALQLSKQTPLYPILDLGNGDPYGPPSCIQALVRHTSRWKTLDVSGSRDAFVNLGQLGNLPILKGLCVSLQASYDPEDHDVPDFDEIMDVSAAMVPFTNCPQLEELTVSLAEGILYNDIIFDTSSLSFPWSNLSKLTVSFGVDLSHFVRSLLLVCHNLRELSVHSLFYEDEESGDESFEPLQLHSGITSLTVIYPMDLLHQTDFPALTHLSLKETSPDEILPFLSRYPRHITHFQVVLKRDSEDEPSDWDPVLRLLPDIVLFTVRLWGLQKQPSWAILSSSIEKQLPQLRTLVVYTKCHLRKFCKEWDIVPLVARLWSARKLEMLEIHSMRVKDGWDPRFGRDMLAVSRKIENSATIRALLGFKAEGLEVNINNIPLSDRSPLLYM